MPSRKLEICWSHEDEDYIVIAEVSAGYPPRGWDPGDPGEFEVLDVYVDNGAKRGQRVYAPGLVEVASKDDRLWDAAMCQLEAYEDDARAEAAERRYDARREGD
jgi:hypothetical protein